MKRTTILETRRVYRIDDQGTALVDKDNPEFTMRISDIPLGTEFSTHGSTPVLREEFDIRHACQLTLCFGERGEAYFSRENGQHLELFDCKDLRLKVTELPYAGH